MTVMISEYLDQCNITAPHRRYSAPVPTEDDVEPRAIDLEVLDDPAAVLQL